MRELCKLEMKERRERIMKTINEREKWENYENDRM